MTLCGSFHAEAANRRYSVVFAMPVRPHYTQEDVLEAALASRISVDVTRITWSERPEDRADLVKRVRAANPDLIYTWGTVTTMALAGTYDNEDGANYILDRPIVFFTVAYPDRTRLVSTLQHPGRNLTGVTHVLPVAQQMHTLLRWGPLRYSAIGTVYNALEPNSIAALGDLRTWCAEHKVTLYAEGVTPAWNDEVDQANIRSAVARLAASGIDWLYIGADKMTGLTYANTLTSSALEHRLPTFSAIETPVRKASALWGLYTPVEPAALKVADMIVAILNGSAVASDIPVITAQQNIVLNEGTMKDLGIYPPTVLRRVAVVVRATTAQRATSK